MLVECLAKVAGHRCGRVCLLLVGYLDGQCFGHIVTVTDIGYGGSCGSDEAGTVILYGRYLRYPGTNPEACRGVHQLEWGRDGELQSNRFARERLMALFKVVLGGI